MITAFTLKNNALQQVKITHADDLTNPDIIWIDLADPTTEERQLIENFFNVELPEKTEIKDIEASARFYQNEAGTHIHSFFLDSFDNDDPNNVTVAFTLFQQRLFTIHDSKLSAFRLFQLRARQPSEEDQNVNAMDILIGLHETSAEHIADVVEDIYTSLEHISPYVLITADDSLKKNRALQEKGGESEEDDIDMDDILTQIAKEEDINGKARLSLMDTRRTLSFLLRSRLLSNEQQEDVREILLDIESLTGHTSFLFDKVNFLLDAAMGKISLEQSRIIKIFSIASVVFLPPTLIASIYGMNFQFMPELNFKYSYPISIALMILSGIAPYLLFRRKGWL